jgi:hypothetical protein
MNLIETVVKEKSVRMRYGNDPDATKATEWAEFEVLIARKADPLLSELQLETLRSVQKTIRDEIARLESLR